MMGRKPKIQSDTKSRVNTFPLLFKRDERRIDAKKIALMLIGENTFRRQSWSDIFFLSGASVTSLLSLLLRSSGLSIII